MNIKKICVSMILLTVLVSMPLTLGGVARADTDTAAQAQVRQTFLASSPSGVQVLHVVVVDGFALLEWRDDESGGEAAFAQQQGQWRQIACGGGAMNSSNLIRYGVPDATATELVEQLESLYQ